MRATKPSVLILVLAVLLATGCSNMFNSFLSHTITYHANGGTGSDSTQTMKPDETVTLSKNYFSRSGYSFLGWALSPSAAKADYLDEAQYRAGISSLDLYAVWAADSVCHTVTFKANGGTGEDKTQSLVEGKASYLRATGFTRSGYVLLGWATKADATSVEYADSAEYAMGKADVTLYAVWAPDSVCHTVTFKANGGTGEDKTQSLVEGKASYLRATGFARSGYVLLGWATRSDATAIEYADGASYSMGSADLTLYAVWSQNAHTISFKVNGGSDNGKGGTATRSVPESGTTALPSGSDLGWSGIEGEIFGGWALSASAQAPDYAAGASYAMGKDDMTLYAIWGYKGLAAISSLSGVDYYGNSITITSGSGVFELGRHYVDNSTTVEIPIKNTGDLPLTISSIELTQTPGYSAFSLSDLPSFPCVIPNTNQWRTVKLTFACASADQYASGAVKVDAILKIKSDDPAESSDGYVLNLSGYLGSP